MKEVKFRLYKFSELDEEVKSKIAKEKAFDVMEDVMEGYAGEYLDSLESFSEATGFSAENWEVGYCGSYFHLSAPSDEVMGSYDYPIYAEDCKGKFLFRWCRNFIDANAKGKYYGKLIPHAKDEEHPAGLEHIKRYSKVQTEPIEGGWTPWTGVVTDCPLVEPIVDFYRNYHRGKFSEDYSLEDLIQDCLHKFFKEWKEQYEYYGENKDDCVLEELENNCNGWFHEDGTEYKGNLKYVC